MNFAMCEKTLTNKITNAKSSNRFVSFKKILATYLTTNSKVEKLLQLSKKHPKIQDLWDFAQKIIFQGAHFPC